MATQFLSMFVLTLSSCAALQLGGAHAPSLAATRVAVRMQTPDVETAPANDAAEAAVVGSVVPTVTSASSEALMERLITQHPDLGLVFRRAEFWSNETTTLLEIINVLGRFKTTEDFRERTEFSVVEDYRKENEAQSETKQRYEMAQRMGCAERVALAQNIPKRPFTNAALAASVGVSVEDFQNLQVNKAACNVVYDALAESRSTLIPFATIDARRAALLDGTEDKFNEVAFRVGLYKSRALIVAAWFMFGKGNFVWVLVFAKALHDLRPDIVPSPVELGLFKIGTFI